MRRSWLCAIVMLPAFAYGQEVPPLVQQAFQATRSATAVYSAAQLHDKEYYDWDQSRRVTVSADMYEDLLQAHARLSVLGLRMGPGDGLVYDGELNVIVVGHELLDRIEVASRSLHPRRRPQVIHDALAALFAERTVELLYHTPTNPRRTHAADVLRLVSPQARYAYLAEANHPERLLQAVAHGGALPRPLALQGEAPVAIERWLIPLAEGIRAAYGYQLQVVAAQVVAAHAPLQIDAERRTLRVSRDALERIDADARESERPQAFRRAALAAWLAQVAAETHGQQADAERLYVQGTVELLRRGQRHASGRPSAGWASTILATDAALRILNVSAIRLVNRGLEVVDDPAPRLVYDGQRGKLRLTFALLTVIEAEAQGTPHPRSFAREVFAELVLREGLRVGGIAAYWTPAEIFDWGRDALRRRGAQPPPSLDYLRRARYDRSPATLAGRELGDALRPSPQDVPYVQGERVWANRATYELDQIAQLRAKHRRGGAVDWKQLLADPLLAEHEHLALALFVEELTAVARSGDAVRIEALFDGLVELGFYDRYGLFAFGADAGPALFKAFLDEHVKPVFVQGVLRAHVAMATGVAQRRYAEVDGPAFMITLTALGISTRAVRAGFQALSCVREVQGASGLREGWAFTASNPAVVLQTAAACKAQAPTYLDRRRAREAIVTAQLDFLSAVARPRADPGVLAGDAQALRAAGGVYRDFLHRPLVDGDLALAVELERIASETRPRGRDAHEALVNVKLREAGERIDAALARHRILQGMLLQTTYAGRVQRTGLLDDAAAAELLEVDPYLGRDGVLADSSRRSLRRQARAALRKRIATNLPQSYADEAQLMTAAVDALRARGADRSALAVAEVLAETRDRARDGRERFETTRGALEALLEAASTITSRD